MKYIFITLIISIMLCSCKENERLDDDKFVAILADMRITYALVNDENIEQKDSILRILKNKVYEIHNITEEEYEKKMKEIEKDFKKGLIIETKVVEKLKSLK